MPQLDINDHEYRKFRDTSKGDAVAVVGPDGQGVSDPTSGYAFCFLDKALPILYISYENSGGEWLVQKIDKTTDIVSTYANESNNPGYTNITDARDDRATLTYQLPNLIF